MVNCVNIISLTRVIYIIGYAYTGSSKRDGILQRTLMPEFFEVLLANTLGELVMIYLLLGAGCWFVPDLEFQFRYIRQFGAV